MISPTSSRFNVLVRVVERVAVGNVLSTVGSTG